MRNKIATLFAIAFVLASAPVACGGGEEEAKQQAEEAKEQAKEQAKEAKEQVQEAKGEKEKGDIKQDEPQVGGPVTKYEDLPEEVKAKLPEQAKQELKQELPEKARQ